MTKNCDALFLVTVFSQYIFCFAWQPLISLGTWEGEYDIQEIVHYVDMISDHIIDHNCCDEEDINDVDDDLYVEYIIIIVV